MTKFRAPAVLVMVLGLCGWGVGPARGQERLVVGDKVERTHVEPVEIDWTDVDPDAENQIPFDMPPRVTAGVSADCNVIGGFFLTLNGQNRYRANVYRVTANARLNQIHMELAYDDPVNFAASVHRRNLDGTYSQVGGDITVPTQSGGGATGVPIFVDSVVIDPPIALEAGFDYAIGFTWGAANMVYARDSVAHPVPFEIGRVLGSVAVNGLIGEPPAVPDTFGNLSVFTGGSYSMLLCLEPEPGACCNASLPVPACEDVLEADCPGAGSYFGGERTTCSETVCNFGACCDPCGTCEDAVAERACEGGVGAVSWSGVACPTIETLLCPKITGACCRPNGTCELTCRRECEEPPLPDLPGVYHGDGSTCSPDPCKGACCLNGFGCADTTEFDCDAFNGVFRGPETTCETLPAGQECPGACCFGTAATGLTGCTDVSARSSCRSLFPQMAYKGEGTVCPASGIPAFCGPFGDNHACCLIGVNACINTIGSECPAHVGDYFGAAQCSTLAGGCQPHRRACCLPNGTCSVLTNAQCSDQGGNWQQGQIECLAGTCVFGACCGDALAECTVTSRSACEAGSGLYRGDGTNCSTPATTCPGFGACCRSEGDCLDEKTPNQCTLVDGAYRSNGSDCTTIEPDCDERVPCCATTGLCLFVIPEQCSEVGGTLPSGATVCGTGTCPTGACCSGETCAIRTPEGCVGENETYLGDATTCTAGICVAAACCNGDLCEMLTETACTEAQGFFAGQGITCDLDRCFTGVCCSVAGDCSTIRSHECAAEDGEFAEARTTCKTGAECDVGACCLGTSCSASIRRINCELADGTFLGDGSLCGVDSCVLGACCDGVDCSNEIRTTCERANRVFRGAGTNCEDVTPPLCPCTTGLQCDDGIYCNGSERCTNGVCGPGPVPCDDGLVCTTDVCNEETDSCTFPRDETACDDGLFCNGAETCSVNGETCLDGTPPICNDELFCNGEESCSDVEGRCVVLLPLPCDDGIFCNGAETCQEDDDTCLEGTPPDCDALDSCDNEAALASLVECISGPTVTPESNCTCLDLDDDGDVDLGDFAAYQLRAVLP